jgi:transposase
MKHRRFKLSDGEIQVLEAAERETREALALRRLQGVRMYGSGLDMKLVKQVTGAARRTVEDWIKAYRTHGVAGLKPGWKGGNSRKLAVHEREELANRLQHMTVEQALSQEERVHGGPFWTVEAVECVVEKWYGVRYRSRESYRLLLVEAGFSFQQPEGIYRSRPSEALIADFEADAEKK